MNMTSSWVIPREFDAILWNICYSRLAKHRLDKAYAQEPLKTLTSGCGCSRDYINPVCPAVCKIIDDCRADDAAARLAQATTQE